jgi:branched-chain amino acid transport system ATP-binding protein
MALLDVHELTKAFGGLVANDHVSFSVAEGEILALIGPNGAGKTTLFNCVSGHSRPTSGTVTFRGSDVTGGPAHKTARQGLVRTFQIPRSFGDMTVLDNVMVGALLWETRVAPARNRAMSVLETVGLADRERDPASTLNVAGQKRLGLARALATNPRVLLLDEVAGGLNPTEVEGLARVLADIHTSGVTLVLVEHVLEVVMQLAERVLVLDYGRLIAEGTPEDIVHDEQVIEAYLGRRHAAG